MSAVKEADLVNSAGGGGKNQLTDGSETVDRVTMVLAVYTGKHFQFCKSFTTALYMSTQQNTIQHFTQQW